VNPKRRTGDLGTLNEISERKQAEEQHRLLSSAVAQNNASIVVTDPAGRIIFINDAFTRITGYARQEALGRNPSFLASGLTAQKIYQSLWQTIRRGETWRGEFQNRKKGGDLYWQSASISPVMDDQGRITHFIAIQEDITDIKRQEAELRQAKEQAEAANLAKSQFLATMSHEIRTPMNGILGMAQLLLLPTLSDEERVEYARTILNSGNTLQTLLDDILDLSKIEAGRLELKPSAVDPLQIVKEAAALFAGPARQKGLSIEATWCGPSSQAYRADGIRIRQMLSNLVSNAIKFTEEGSIRIEAEEDGRQGGAAQLLFAVTDTGIGVNADKQELLFQPFSQVDTSSTRRYGGTGLGLSIVKRLAGLMGGCVGVDSQPGKGSRFWFRIPASLVSADEEGRAAGRWMEKAPAIAPGEQPARAHILVVEDNAINRRVIETLLAKQGCRVACAQDGQEAVDALTGGARPDLVLMDCQMPVMDGVEATRRIRQWERENGRPAMTIVALTASAFEDDRNRCLEAGMDDFLAKPVIFDELLAVLGKWLPQDGRREVVSLD